MNTLLYGLVTGIAFGFLLQKGRVLRYDRQLGVLRLKDMTIIKFMLSSVMVGMVGVYLLVDLELAKLSIKATILGGNILGGSSSASAGGCWATAPAPQPAPWPKVAGMQSGASWG
jgi:hypothetical protein